MDFDFIKGFAATLPFAEKARLAQFLLTETVWEHHQNILEQNYLPFSAIPTIWEQLEAAKQVPFGTKKIDKAPLSFDSLESKVTRVSDQFFDAEFEEIFYREEREKTKVMLEEFTKRWEGKTAEVWTDIKYDIDLQFLPVELEQMRMNKSVIDMNLREYLPDPIMLTPEEEKLLRP